MIPTARFYKGEDIRLTIGAFLDEELTVPGSFEGYGVDVLLATGGDGECVLLSSEAATGDERWLPLSRNEDGTMEATIGKRWTAALDPGVVRVEIRLTSLATGESYIASKGAFLLVESRLAEFEPCMRK